MGGEISEIRVYEQIREAFPALSGEECETALLLLKARAETMGTMFERYIDRFHPEGLAGRDEELSEEYRGYTRFLGEDAKAVIRVGEGADFSTFIHENAHVFRRQLTGNLRKKAERAFGVERFGTWTAEREEAFALGLEEYVRTCKTRGNEDKENVFKQGKRFVQRVYDGLDRIIEITPEMRAVYDGLFETNKVEINGKEYEFNRERYEKHIHNIAMGEIKGTHVLLGATPPVYEELGFERLPMMITREHLSKIMREKDLYNGRENYHGLGEDVLKRIPEQLKDPAVIVRSKKTPQDIVSIVELQDKDGNQIIVPIAQNITVKHGRLEINVNLAKTIYGKDDFEHFLKKAVKENRLLYVNKKRNPTLVLTNRLANSGVSVGVLKASLLTTPGLRLPIGQDVSGFYRENIARYKEIVKRAREESREILYQRSVKRKIRAPDTQMVFNFDEAPSQGGSVRTAATPETPKERPPDKRTDAAGREGVEERTGGTAFTAGAFTLAAENTPEHFFENVNRITETAPAYKDDPVEAARELLRASEPEARRALTAYLSGNGAASPMEMRERITREYALFKRERAPASELVSDETPAPAGVAPERANLEGKIRSGENYLRSAERMLRTYKKLSAKRIYRMFEEQGGIELIDGIDVKTPSGEFGLKWYGAAGIKDYFLTESRIGINRLRDEIEGWKREKSGAEAGRGLFDEIPEKAGIENPSRTRPVQETGSERGRPVESAGEKEADAADGLGGGEADKALSEESRPRGGKLGSARSAVSEDHPCAEAARKEGGSFRPYGAWTDFDSRLSLSERERLNREALEIIGKESSVLTGGETAVLRRYSGFGGLGADNERGVLYDFYTSPPIADMTWKLLEKAGGKLKEGAKVLEPSCGAGVFFETAPAGVSLTGVELDPRAAAIAAALHAGTATVVNSSFEQFNRSENHGGFDAVVGNAPFGERSVDTSFMDEPEEKSLDRYFVSRGVDNLKPGGVLALIAAPGVLGNKSSAAWRVNMSRKARFLGAAGLPDASFYHTQTAVQPVILLFRKYPDDITARLSKLTRGDFEESGLFDESFINGTYFETRGEHIMGEVSEGTGRWGGDEIKGGVTPDRIAALLAAFTPVDESRDEELFSELRETYDLEKAENHEETLYLTKEEREAVEDKRLVAGNLKVVEDAVYLLDETYIWRKAAENKALAAKLSGAFALSQSVHTVRSSWRNGLDGEADSARRNLKVQLEDFKTAYGNYPEEDADIRRFLNKHPAIKGVYEALITPDSEIAASENPYKQDAPPVDGHNPAIAALWLMRTELLPGGEEAIRRRFPDNADGLIAEMYRNPDIFRAPDGTWELREDFVSGNAWEKIDALRAAAERERDAAKKTKLAYGIDALKEAVGWTPVEEADFSPPFRLDTGTYHKPMGARRGVEPRTAVARRAARKKRRRQMGRRV
jgi:predicted RNA methylase